MSDDVLSQSDADTLLRMDKVPATCNIFVFPDLGGRIEVPLISRNERERFSLDINRKRIALTTGFQTRGRQVIVLARLDFAAPHRNPEDTWQVLYDFMKYCGVVEQPNIVRGLFS